jgi:hypothetical protein
MKQSDVPLIRVRVHDALAHCALTAQSVELLAQLDSRTTSGSEHSVLDCTESLQMSSTKAVADAQRATQAWKALASLESHMGRLFLEEYRVRRQICEEEDRELQPIEDAAAFLRKDRLNYSQSMLDVRESQNRNRIVDTYWEYVEQMTQRLDASKEAARVAQRARETEAARRAAAMRAMEDDIVRNERERQERSQRNVQLLQEQSEARARRQQEEMQRRANEALAAKQALAQQTATFEIGLQQREESLRQRAAEREAQRAQTLDSLFVAERDLMERLEKKQSERSETIAVVVEHCSAEEQLIRQRLEERQRADQEAAALLAEHVRAEEELLQQRLRARELERIKERNDLLQALADEEQALLRRREQAEQEERRRRMRELQEQEEALVRRQQSRAQEGARAFDQQLEFVRLQEEKYRLRLAQQQPPSHSYFDDQPPPYSQ